MDGVTNSLGLGSSSADPKAAVMNQVRQEAALQNAKQLIDKLNEHCFEKCVPKPSTSLSSGESSCFTQCMEKYMDAWNTVSKQYIGRITQNSASRNQGGGGMF